MKSRVEKAPPGSGTWPRLVARAGALPPPPSPRAQRPRPSSVCAPLAASHTSCADSAPTTEGRRRSPFPLSRGHHRPPGTHRRHPSVSPQVRWPRPPCCRSAVTARAVACTSARSSLPSCHPPHSSSLVPSCGPLSGHSWGSSPLFQGSWCPQWCLPMPKCRTWTAAVRPASSQGWAPMFPEHPEPCPPRCLCPVAGSPGAIHKGKVAMGNLQFLAPQGPGLLTTVSLSLSRGHEPRIMTQSHIPNYLLWRHALWGTFCRPRGQGSAVQCLLPS